MLEKFFISGGLKQIDVTVSSNKTNYNLFTASGSPGDPVIVNFTVNAGVTITGAPAVLISGFAAGSQIIMVCNGIIKGNHGPGRTCGTANGYPGQRGLQTGANCYLHLTINSTGRIYGGGGGGGATSGATSGRNGNGGAGGDGIYLGHDADIVNSGYIFGGGGGGGGEGNGGGGTACGVYYHPSQGGYDNAHGGAGGDNNYPGIGALYPAAAGGTAGNAGQNGATPRPVYADGGYGGAAGYAIRSNGHSLSVSGSTSSTYIRGVVG